MEMRKRKRWHETANILIKNRLCVLCKGPLPKDYEFDYCCDGYGCGCNGLPVGPWTCCKTCKELSWLEYPYWEYYHMWR